jgi:tetratricopeptide (TPR) repeat protein
MSDPNLKGVKRSSTRQTSAAASVKNRPLAGKSARPTPLVKRSATDKAPARKAAKAKTAPAKTKPTKQSTKPAPAEKLAARKSGGKPTHTAKQAKSITAAVVKTTKKRVPQAKSTTQIKPVLQVKQPPQAKLNASAATRKQAPPAQPPVAAHRQPTRDEAAALRAFERAHKEFTRGRFAEARTLFRALVEEHAGVSEITARARTYLAVAETRLRSEQALPRDADSLYDRGVIELNRGEFVAAQELFERALKREPEAAHIHYGLAATRARLGSSSSALESLQRALDLQPKLRVRAQHDQDLATLRNDPEFDALMFAPRS